MEKGKFENGEDTEITVDSGAEENVCPKDWGSQFKIHKPEKILKLVNASGRRIDHYGSRVVRVTSLF